MAATETRLLLLGTVMLFEPVNGYQLRRELLSWQVEDWAHVNPGSIYSGLSTLARQGNLERSGRREFERLWRAAVESVDLLSPLPFHTALALMPLMARADVVQGLRSRLARIDVRIREQLAQESQLETVPPHVRAMADLWMGLGSTEREWLVDLLGRVAAGAFELRGEPVTWQPPAQDPGWQMAGERQRYAELIARHR
jgi:hypothetical protein